MDHVKRPINGLDTIHRRRNSFHYPLYIGAWRDTIRTERVAFSTLWEDRSSQNTSQPTKHDKYLVSIVGHKTYARPDTSELVIQIDTSQIVNYAGRKAFPVLLKNSSQDTLQVGWNQQFNLILEGKNRDGLWKPLERLPYFSCATGLYQLILNPNEIGITSSLVTTGNYKTKLRLRMGPIASNEYDGYINESQFE